MQKLSNDFYWRSNVVQISKELLGKLLVTNIHGIVTVARITETEAYNGIADKASHAYNNRRTARTDVMYKTGGTAYVYLCYGIHHLFNVVTNIENVPHAVLIRAVQPVKGEEMMLLRMNKKQGDISVTRGPGNVSKAMGITTKYSGYSLHGDEIYIADDGHKISRNQIVATPRIGVDYAAEDALLPYRFFIKGNIYVSGRRR